MPSLGALLGLVLVAASASFSIDRLPINDRHALTEVFRGGQPWLVFCAGALLGSEEQQPAFAGFRETARILGIRGEVQAAVLDCGAKLPSGKSTYERFGLERQNRYPTVFFCANGERPQQLSAEDFVVYERSAAAGGSGNGGGIGGGGGMGSRGGASSGGSGARVARTNSSALLGLVEARAQLRLTTASSFPELSSACLKRRACALVLSWGRLTGPQQSVLARTMHRHRNVTFVRVDASTHKMPLMRKLPKLDSDADAAAGAGDAGAANASSSGSGSGGGGGGGGGGSAAKPPRLVLLRPISRIDAVAKGLRVPYIRVPDGSGSGSSGSSGSGSGSSSSGSGGQSPSDWMKISLSGNKLRAAKNLTRGAADRIFDRKLISYDSFAGRGAQVLAHPNALFEIAGARYPWGVAAQFLVAHSLYGQRMDRESLRRATDVELRRQARALVARSPRDRKFEAKAHVGPFSASSLGRFVRRFQSRRLRMGKLTSRNLRLRKKKKKKKKRKRKGKAAGKRANNKKKKKKKKKKMAASGGSGSSGGSSHRRRSAHRRRASPKQRQQERAHRRRASSSSKEKVRLPSHRRRTPGSGGSGKGGTGSRGGVRSGDSKKERQQQQQQQQQQKKKRKKRAPASANEEDVDREQREEEALRRQELDREAQKHMPQGVEEGEEDGEEDAEGGGQGGDAGQCVDGGDGCEDEVIDLDEEEDEDEPLEPPPPAADEDEKEEGEEEGGAGGPEEGDEEKEDALRQGDEFLEAEEEPGSDEEEGHEVEEEPNDDNEDDEEAADSQD
jgi:hypothetical protein